MPIWLVSYYDENTKDTKRKGTIRAERQSEADQLVFDNILPGEVIWIHRLDRDEADFPEGYAEFPALDV